MTFFYIFLLTMLAVLGFSFWTYIVNEREIEELKLNAADLNIKANSNKGVVNLTINSKRKSEKIDLPQWLIENPLSDKPKYTSLFEQKLKRQWEQVSYKFNETDLKIKSIGWNEKNGFVLKITGPHKKLSDSSIRRFSNLLCALEESVTVQEIDIAYSFREKLELWLKVIVVLWTIGLVIYFLLTQPYNYQNVSLLFKLALLSLVFSIPLGYFVANKYASESSFYKKILLKVITVSCISGYFIAVSGLYYSVHLLSVEVCHESATVLGKRKTSGRSQSYYANILLSPECTKASYLKEVEVRLTRWDYDNLQKNLEVKVYKSPLVTFIEQQK